MAVTRSLRAGEIYNSTYELDADQNLFPSHYTATIPGGSLRISVALATTSTLKVYEYDGTTAHVHILNKNTALDATYAFTFDFAIIVGNQYNIRVGTTQLSAIPRIVLQEIDRS